MKLIDRIVVVHIIESTLLVSAVILSIQFFLNIVQEFYAIGTHDYTVWHAFLFSLMQLPAQFYELFPMAGFLGALTGLGRLSATSQLIVIRMSGVSISMLVTSVIKAALIMIIIVTVLGEGLGLHWQQKADTWRRAWIAGKTNAETLHSIWLRQGNHFTHIGQLNSQDTISDVTRYYFSNNDRLLRASYAPTGKLENGHWELHDVQQSIFDHDTVTTVTHKKQMIPIVFKPKLQVRMHTALTQQSLSSLLKTIQYRHDMGLSADQYVFAFSQRLLQPLATLVMFVLAIPFVFGSFRETKMGTRLLFGLVVGFIFYMLNQLFGPITMVYQFPPFLSAFLPTCLFLFVASALLMRTR